MKKKKTKLGRGRKAKGKKEVGKNSILGRKKKGKVSKGERIKGNTIIMGKGDEYKREGSLEREEKGGEEGVIGSKR